MNQQNDPYHFVRDRYKKNLELFDKKLSDYVDQKKMVFSLVWKYCDVPLQNALRHIDDWEEIETSKNLIRLWNAIDEIEQLGMNAHMNESQRRIAGQIRFQRVMQLTHETVGAFYQKFETAYEAFVMASNRLREEQIFGDDEAADNARADLRVAEEAEKASHFIRKSDKRLFGPLIDEMANDYAAGNQNAYHATLADAYRRASTYKFHGRLLAEVAPAQVEVVFERVSGLETTKKSYPHSGKKISEVKLKGSYPKQNMKGKQPNVIKAESAEEKPKKTKGKCWICGSADHWKKDCPSLQKAKDQYDADETAAYADGEGYITLATGVPTIKDTVILLDNQASVSVFKNASLLENIRSINSNIKIAGIGGVICVDKVGDFGDFGLVYYHPDSVANLLCFSDVAKKGHVVYDNPNNQFVVTINGRTVVFRSKHKLYIWDNNQATVMIQTVADNMH